MKRELLVVKNICARLTADEVTMFRKGIGRANIFDNILELNRRLKYKDHTTLIEWEKLSNEMEERKEQEYKELLRRYKWYTLITMEVLNL